MVLHYGPLWYIIVHFSWAPWALELSETSSQIPKSPWVLKKKSRSNDLVFGVPLHSSPSESVHGAIRKCSEGTSMNHHFVQTATQTVFKNPYHGIIHLLSCSSDFPPIIMCSHFFVPSVPWDLDILSGWWYTYPAEKYDEFVSDDEIPNWMEKT
jgi:hypothetical protein